MLERVGRVRDNEKENVRRGKRKRRTVFIFRFGLDGRHGSRYRDISLLAERLEFALLEASSAVPLASFSRYLEFARARVHSRHALPGGRVKREKLGRALFGDYAGALCDRASRLRPRERH